MTLFLQYLAAGIASGSTFALVATGFVVIYRVTGVINFAQGVFAVLGGFLAYSLLHAGVAHGLAEGLAVLITAAIGLVVGLVALGRRGTPPLASLIVTLGLAIFSYAVVITIWGDLPISYDGLSGLLAIRGVSMQRQYVLIVGVAVVTFLALALFFGRTYLGMALTACSSDQRAARLMGIDVWRMGLLAFAVGGALGGLAGVLLTPLQPVQFDSDVGIAVNGFAAAIFGGLVRPVTAFAGGLVLGVAEAMVAGYYRSSYETAIALAVMLVLMLWQASRRGPTEE